MKKLIGKLPLPTSRQAFPCPYVVTLYILYKRLGGVY